MPDRAPADDDEHEQDEDDLGALGYEIVGDRLGYRLGTAGTWTTACVVGLGSRPFLGDGRCTATGLDVAA